MSLSKQGSGKFHHGYGYDPNSDGWKVDCSSGTQRSFSTYTVAKPEVSLESASVSMGIDGITPNNLGLRQPQCTAELPVQAHNTDI